MSKEPFTIERFHAELEGYGPLKVREYLAMGRWGKTGTHFELATDWLRQLDQNRAHEHLMRNAEVAAEQLRIDLRANKIAITAAAAAVIAAIMATIAAVISVLAYLRAP